MSVAGYFDSVAPDYSEHYNPDNLLDMSRPYPANYIRLQMLKKSFADRKNIIDVGCGDGTPLLELWKSNTRIGITGFDISQKMVDKANEQGLKAIVADLMKPETYESLLKYGPFDGLIAMGVMPHIKDTEQALRNMKALVKGKVFIEFRNDLFNLFAMNEGTARFIAYNLIEWDAGKAFIELADRLPMLKVRPYDKILSQFHNPFEVKLLFQRLDFTEINLLYYHYHATLPWLDDNDVELRKVALAMEGQPQTWKSMFQCSAFVVEAWSE